MRRTDIRTNFVSNIHAWPWRGGSIGKGSIILASISLPPYCTHTNIRQTSLPVATAVKLRAATSPRSNCPQLFENSLRRHIMRDHRSVRSHFALCLVGIEHLPVVPLSPCRLPCFPIHTSSLPSCPLQCLIPVSSLLSLSAKLDSCSSRLSTRYQRCVDRIPAPVRCEHWRACEPGARHPLLSHVFGRSGTVNQTLVGPKGRQP